MRHFGPFQQRAGRVGWRAVLATSLLLADGSGKEPCGGPPDSFSAKPASAAAHAKPSQDHQPSAAALVQKVYDSFGWIDSAHSFRIRAEYVYIPTNEGPRGPEKRAGIEASAKGNGKLRTFCEGLEWAWDKNRIHYSHDGYYAGDPKSTHARQTRVWNGSLAIEFGERGDHTNQSYALDNKFNLFFEEQHVTPQLMLPWGPGGPHHFWWLPTDVAAYRESMGLLAQDFQLVGKETINGKPCEVVESSIGDYRLAIGVADGRLYRRTWLRPVDRIAGYSPDAVFRKVAGPSIKTYQQFRKWYEALEPAKRSRADHDFRVAEAEFVGKKRIAFHQFFDDYREVAPGRWLPFQQFVMRYTLRATEPVPESRAEQTVTAVSVNEPLPDELFQIELRDGVEVRTDWRYDPPIHYTYSKAQTESERLELRDLERKKRHEAAR
jgi:hypothetical protein